LAKLADKVVAQQWTRTQRAQLSVLDECSIDYDPFY
jgi:hypothetical protein